MSSLLFIERKQGTQYIWQSACIFVLQFLQVYMIFKLNCLLLLSVFCDQLG